MKNFLPFTLAIIVAGCFTPGQMPVKTQTPDNNQDYKVDYLFEHDGCKVFRFYDRGNVVYFTNCNGEAIVKTDSTEIRNIVRK